METMELLPLVSLCLLFGAKITAGDVNGPAVIKVFVEEDSDAILPCSFGSTNIKGDFFVWKKVGEVREVYLYEAGRIDRSEGRVSHFENDLQNGNASIVIKGTKLADKGNYTCNFPRDQSEIKSRVELIVGACPEPYVKILDQTKDWSLLQCVVRGASPKPKVEWQDSSGNILPAKEPQVTERGGSYDITLQITVTKTDYYSCVVTQEEICHQIEDDIFVYIHHESSLSSTGLIVAVVILALVVLVLVGVVVKLCNTRNSKKDEEKGETLKDPSDSGLLPEQSGPSEAALHVL